MYFDYLKEREPELNILQVEHGFALYKYIPFKNGELAVYIQDIYITPEKRKSHGASYLANIIYKEAKEKGIKTMLGSVCPSAVASQTSLQVLISFGMTIHSSEHDLIWFYKDIV